MTPAATTQLLSQLSERDVAIIQSLRTYRLLTTAHIRRLHFASGHATLGAAAAAVMRVLTRLESRNVVKRLSRRVGGVRAGSSSISWQLGAAGERLLRTMHGETNRHRYLEPSPAFTAHTTAIAELAVGLHELKTTGAIELLTIDTEPSCWRSFIGPHGVAEWLKPDLSVVTANGDYEDHWMVEVDLASEHPPVIVRKAKVYQRYAATGTHQAEHGLFPAVIWVVPDQARQQALQKALAADRAVQAELFRVVTTEQVLGFIANGNPEPPP